MRLVLSSHKLSSRILNQATRILKVYPEALTGFSHIFSPPGLNNILLSRLHPCKELLLLGTVNRILVPRTAEVGRNLLLPRSSLWVNERSQPLDNLLLHLYPLHLQFIIHFL